MHTGVTCITQPRNFSRSLSVRGQGSRAAAFWRLPGASAVLSPSGVEPRVAWLVRSALVLGPHETFLRASLLRAAGGLRRARSSLAFYVSGSVPRGFPDGRRRRRAALMLFLEILVQKRKFRWQRPRSRRFADVGFTSPADGDFAGVTSARRRRLRNLVLSKLSPRVRPQSSPNSGHARRYIVGIVGRLRGCRGAPPREDS